MSLVRQRARKSRQNVRNFFTFYAIAPARARESSAASAVQQANELGAHSRRRRHLVTCTRRATATAATRRIARPIFFRRRSPLIFSIPRALT